ncbi:MAG TPA: AMP-binding protein [Candidatus Limnocylindrales bacterium]|nr:AMP-binding protein [Candidatus Limnocylindrales bacterium]
MGSAPDYLQVARDLWRAQREGPTGIARRQARRLATLVAHARARSPYFARHYAGVPTDGWRLADLPPTTKPELMAAFDDWLTDPSITRADLETFIADPERAGEPYRDGLFVCTTSGTTGHPGLFVHDRPLVAVYRALTIVRLDLAWLSALDWVRLVRRGIRWAAVVGTGSHFAGTAWVEFERHRNPVNRWAYRTFSVQRPLAELVDALNAFDPAILSTYPSALELLAEEQVAGRLRVRPTILETAGESMTADARSRVTFAFGAPVHDVYGSTEFTMMAMDCPMGWLHVNADWVVLEPVDAELRPAAVGLPSHTVLLTSLADRLQPIIRYDLGDSVLARPDPCPCGSPFPAIRVEGRRDDVLRLATRDGRSVAILPLAISAALESTRGVHRSQVVQTGPSALRIRLEPEADARADDVWVAVVGNLRAYLEDQGLDDVELVRADERPQQNPVSGKFRQVIAAAAQAPEGRSSPVA